MHILPHGAEVIVTDLEESRLARARKWGAAAALDASSPAIREEILRLCGGGGDIAVECTANLAGARLCSSVLRQPYPRRYNCAYLPEKISACTTFFPRLVFQASAYKSDSFGPAGLASAEGVTVLNPGDRLAVIEQVRAGHLDTMDFASKPVPVADAPEEYLELRDKPGKLSSLSFKW